MIGELVVVLLGPELVADIRCRAVATGLKVRDQPFGQRLPPTVTICDMRKFLEKAALARELEVVGPTLLGGHPPHVEEDDEVR